MTLQAMRANAQLMLMRVVVEKHVLPENVNVELLQVVSVKVLELIVTLQTTNVNALLLLLPVQILESLARRGLASVEQLQHVLAKPLEHIVTPQTIFVNARQVLQHVVELPILALLVYVNVVAQMHVVTQARVVVLGHVNVEQHQLALVRRQDHTVMQQTTYANVRQLLQHALEHLTLVPVVSVNVARQMRAVILVKPVAQGHANAVQHQLVLDKPRDLTAMPRTTYANVLQV